jgi:multicomponent Na+:H+ antiporter subunit D
LGDSGGWGVTGAIYHILADAMMTLCLFIAAGIFARSFNATHISDLEGLFKKSPWVAAGFVIGALAMIGVPPTCGFFSKFYLVRGGIDAGHWEYVAALLISSLVNAILFFRIFEIAHFGNKPPEGHGHHAEEVTPVKGSWNSTAPLLLSAAGIILLGLFNGQIVELIRIAVDDIPSLSANLKF